MTEPDTNNDLLHLMQRANRASSAYEWDEAVALTTQALAFPDLPPETEYDLRKGRAVAYEYLGDQAAWLADAERMQRLAEESGDVSKQVESGGRRVEALLELGRLTEASAVADACLALARAAGDPKLVADGLQMLAYASIHHGGLLLALKAIWSRLWNDIALWANGKARPLCLTYLAWAAIAIRER